MVICKGAKYLLPAFLVLMSSTLLARQLKVMTFNIWHGGRETGEM